MKIMIKYILILCVTQGLSQNQFTLDEAIEYALSKSSDMKLAAMDVREAESKIKEFRSIGLPQVNAGVDYNYYIYAPVNPVPDFITPAIYGVLEQEFPNEVSAPMTDPEIFEFSFFTKHNLSAKVDASMLLFDGSYLVGLRAAKLYKELTAKSAAVKEEEIIAKVTKAYMNILIMDENKKTLEKNQSSINQSLTEAQAYYDNGFIEQLEVSRISLSQETVSAEIEKINQAIIISKDLLKFQMNYPLDQTISLTEDLMTLVEKMSIEEVQMTEEIDYTKKAQYDQILMGRELNALNLERIKKGYLPSLSARAGVTESLQRNKLFDNEEIGWLPTVYAGLAMNIPIVDGQRKKSLIEQAEIELDRNELQQREFERVIQMEVYQARNTFKNAKKSLENKKRILEVNEDIYNKTTIKFREGVGSSIEVIQAENGLFAAQSEYISALYDLLITKTDLDLALGNL